MGARPRKRAEHLAGLDEAHRRIATLEADLAEGESFYRLTFDQAPIGAALVGLDFRFQRVNARFERMTGYAAEELLERGFPKITHPDDVALDVAEVGPLAAGEIEEYAREKRYVRKDGSIAWGDVVVRPVTGDDGQPLAFVAMVADVTERKLAEDEILHLNEELRERVVSRTEQLNATTRELVRQAIDVSALAAEVGAEVAAEAPSRDVELAVQAGMTADADPSLLRLILRELLANAWKFTSRHETARVDVGALDVDGERAFFVRDDGAGFDMRYAERLFGVFQRLHTPKQFEGDGVGLATVQRLVRRHGGRVWAEAEVNEGATFYFTLPARSA